MTTEIAFLRAVGPRLGIRPEGYRRNLPQVFKRIRKRLQVLGLSTLDDYFNHLSEHPAEWAVLDALCTVTISRFYRDAPVFDAIRARLFPSWRGGESVWSLGCASGEEPWSLLLAWEADRQERGPVHITAADRDPTLLARAKAGVYREGSLDELPPGLRALGFDREGVFWKLSSKFRDSIAFLVMDVRHALPDGEVNLVCVRNLVFTYVDEAGQRAFLGGLRARMRPGAWLVIGKEEHIPDVGEWLVPVGPCAYVRRS